MPSALGERGALEQLAFQHCEHCGSLFNGKHFCAGSDTARYLLLSQRYSILAQLAPTFEGTWLDDAFHVACRKCGRHLTVPDAPDWAIEEAWLHRDRCYPELRKPDALRPKAERWRDLLMFAVSLEGYRTVKREFNVRPRFGDRRRRLAVYTVECVRCSERIALSDAAEGGNDERIADHERLHEFERLNQHRTSPVTQPRSASSITKRT